MNCDSRAQHIRERVVADQAALSRGKGHNPLVDAHSRRASAHLSSQQMIASRICYNRLINLEFEIDACELLAGRIKQPILPTDELQAAQEFLAAIPDPGGQTGHCEVATAELFALGIDGLLAKIANRRESAETTDQAEVYESFMDALRGLSAMIEHAALPAEAALKTAGPERRAELDAIIASCRRIAHQPPETFLDALHLVWFVPLAIQVGDSVGLVCSGHIDRRLIAYYTADLAAGRDVTNDRLKPAFSLPFKTAGLAAGFSSVLTRRKANVCAAISLQRACELRCRPTGPHLNRDCVAGCRAEILRGVKHMGSCAGEARILGATIWGRTCPLEANVDGCAMRFPRSPAAFSGRGASPEKYRDLIVRIGGYSDYFNHLSLDVRKEMARRFGNRQ
jgi:hypothetical protein